MQTQRITWRNGLRLNGEPVFISDVQKIYEERIYAKSWRSTNRVKPKYVSNAYRPLITNTHADTWLIGWGSDYEYDADSPRNEH
jgi:hypothetical protein